MSGTSSLQRPFQLRPVWAVVGAALLVALAVGGLFAYQHAVRWYYLRAAEQARARGDTAAQHAYLQACLKAGVADPDIYLEAARAARRLGAFDEAERHLKQYESARGPTPDLNLERLLLGIQSGNLRTDDPVILDFVRQAPPDQPGLPELLEPVAEGFLKQYDLTEAQAVLTLWADRDPSNARPLLLRGWILEQLAPSPVPAIPDYQRAVELEPENRVARLRLAEALVSTRQAAEALPHLEALRRQRPDDPLVLLNLALCRHDLGDLKQAREAADAALTPERVAQAEELAAVVRGGRPVPAAVADADWYKGLMAEVPDVNRNDPTYVVNLFVRSLVERAKLAEGDAGEGFLREAVKLDPFDYFAVYQLVVFLEGRGLEKDAKPWRARMEEIKADAARVQGATRRVVQSPHDPEPRCQAAEVALRRGQLEYARRWIAGALQQDPGNVGALRLQAEYERRARAGRLEALGPKQSAGGADHGAAPSGTR